MHDIFSNRHRLFAEHSLGRGYWVSLKPRDEMTAFQRADTLIAIQDEEASQVRRVLQRAAGRTPNVTVVSHLPALADAPLDTSRGHAAHFLGSDNPPNRLSINHFIDATLPIILRDDPDFELFVIGSVCRKVQDHPNVVKLGFVDDPVDAFRRAPLSINPMRLGTGVSIKLLDAMAVGAPVVATSQGARGVPEDMLAGVVVVDDLDNAAFAREVLLLTADSERRARLGQLGHEAARALAVRHRRALAEVLDPDRSKSSPTETEALKKSEVPA